MEAILSNTEKGVGANKSKPKENVAGYRFPDEKGKGSPDDLRIHELLAQLLDLDEPELSEKYTELFELIRERASLNLDGVLRRYWGSDKSKALGLVFNLVEKSSIQSLLLQNNAIDAETLKWALIASGGLGGQHKLRKLKTLHLSNNRLGTRPFSAGAIVAGASGVDTLASALGKGWVPALQELRLSSNDVECSGFQALATAFKTGKVSSLRILDLGNNGMSISTAYDAHMALADAMGSGFLSALEELRLPGCGLDSDCCKAYAAAMSAVSKQHLSGLKAVDFSGNRIQSDGANSLAEAFKVGGQDYTLREIDFSGNKIGSSFARMDFQGLLVLRLRGTGLDRGTVPALPESLKILDLSSTSLGDDVVESLIRGNCRQLKELHLRGTWMGAKGFQKLGEAFERDYFRSLEVLNLSNNAYIGDTDVSHFVESFLRGTCRQLKELHLEYTGMGAEGLRKLGEAFEKDYFRSLEVLNLSNNAYIGDTDVSHFVESFLRGTCRQLKELHLQAIRMEDKGLQKLGEAFEKDYFGSLEVLKLSNNAYIGDTGVSHFVESLLRSNCRQLRVLHFQNTRMGAKGLRKLGEAFEKDCFGSLEILHLPFQVRYSQDEQEAKAGFRFRYIRKSKFELLKDLAVSHFVESFLRGTCRQLKELHLEYTGMGAEGLRKLGEAFEKDYFRSLEVLNLSNNAYIGDTDVSHFVESFLRGTCRQLKELHLQAIRMEDKGLQKLGEAFEKDYFGSLEVLKLSNNAYIGDTGVSHFVESLLRSNCRQLRVLHLQNTRMGAKGLRKLGEAFEKDCFGSLEILHLSFQAWYSQDEQEAKAGFPKKLKFDNDSAVSHFVDSLLRGNCCQLKVLDLERTGMGAEGLRKLGEAFEKDYFGSLEVLNLSNTAYIGDTAVINFVESLLRGTCHELKELYLQGTRMGAEGLRKLGEAFEKDYFRSLEVLNLSNNVSIGDTAVSHFGKNLCGCHLTQLRELHLQDTGMGDEGLKEIAKASEGGHLQSLEVLDVSYNSIGDMGVLALAASLQSGRSNHLKQLLLSHTKVGDEGLEGIQEAAALGDLKSDLEVDVQKTFCTRDWRRISSMYKDYRLTVDSTEEGPSGRISESGLAGLPGEKSSDKGQSHQDIAIYPSSKVISQEQDFERTQIVDLTVDPGEVQKVPELPAAAENVRRNINSPDLSEKKIFEEDSDFREISSHEDFGEDSLQTMESNVLEVTKEASPTDIVPGQQLLEHHGGAENAGFDICGSYVQVPITFEEILREISKEVEDGGGGEMYRLNAEWMNKVLSTEDRDKIQVIFQDAGYYETITNDTEIYYESIIHGGSGVHASISSSSRQLSDNQVSDSKEGVDFKQLSSSGASTQIPSTSDPSAQLLEVGDGQKAKISKLSDAVVANEGQQLLEHNGGAENAGFDISGSYVQVPITSEEILREISKEVEDGGGGEMYRLNAEWMNKLSTEDRDKIQVIFQNAGYYETITNDTEIYYESIIHGGSGVHASISSGSNQLNDNQVSDSKEGVDFKQLSLSGTSTQIRPLLPTFWKWVMGKMWKISNLDSVVSKEELKVEGCANDCQSLPLKVTFIRDEPHDQGQSSSDSPAQETPQEWCSVFFSTREKLQTEFKKLGRRKSREFEFQVEIVLSCCVEREQICIKLPYMRGQIIDREATNAKFYIAMEEMRVSLSASVDNQTRLLNIHNLEKDGRHVIRSAPAREDYVHTKRHGHDTSVRIEPSLSLATVAASLGGVSMTPRPETNRDFCRKGDILELVILKCGDKPCPNMLTSHVLVLQRNLVHTRLTGSDAEKTSITIGGDPKNTIVKLTSDINASTDNGVLSLKITCCVELEIAYIKLSAKTVIENLVEKVEWETKRIQFETTCGHAVFQGEHRTLLPLTHQSS